MEDKLSDLTPNMVQVNKYNSINCLDLYHSLVDNTFVIIYWPDIQKEKWRKQTNHWWIQDFPGRGAIYYLANFGRKLHDNEENWTGDWSRSKFRTSVDPPLQTYPKHFTKRNSKFALNNIFTTYEFCTNHSKRKKIRVPNIFLNSTHCTPRQVHIVITMGSDFNKEFI